MARKRYWIGSTGPFFYDDAAVIKDPQGIRTEVQQGIFCEGKGTFLEAPVEDEDAVRLIDLGVSFVDLEAQSFFFARIY